MRALVTRYHSSTTTSKFSCEGFEVYHLIDSLISNLTPSSYTSYNIPVWEGLAGERRGYLWYVRTSVVLVWLALKDGGSDYAKYILKSLFSLFPSLDDWKYFSLCTHFREVSRLWFSLQYSHQLHLKHIYKKHLTNLLNARWHFFSLVRTTFLW